MNTYETLLALDPNLEAENSTSLIESMKEVIARGGGNIIKEKDLGKKKFAYPVNKFQSGFYYLLYFSAGPEVIGELERNLKLSEDVLRYLTIKLDEKELEHALALLEKEEPASREER